MRRATIRTEGHDHAGDNATPATAGDGVALSPRRRHERAVGAAVADLFEQHGRMVYGLCRMQLGSREEAEDAAQQTFLSAHRTLLRGGSCREPAAWLATIARNECRRRHGRRRLEVVPLHDAEPSGGAGPDRLVIEREELEALHRALAALPRAQRQAIVLREFYGLSYEEVAAALGRSGRAVESLLFKSRRTLNAQLQPLRDAAGALVLPATLRDSLANLIAGFSSSSGAAAAGAGGVAMAKVAGLPVGAKIAALLAAGAAATGLATESVIDGSPRGRPATPPPAHQRSSAATRPQPSANGPAWESAPVVFGAPAGPSSTIADAAPSSGRREHAQERGKAATDQLRSEASSAERSDGGGGERSGSSSRPGQTGEREQTRTDSQRTGDTQSTRASTTESQPIRAATPESQTTQTQTQTQTIEGGDGRPGSGGSGGQDGGSGQSTDD